MVSLNGIDTRGLEAGKFRQTFSKIVHGRLLHVDVLKVDPTSNLLKQNAQVILI